MGGLLGELEALPTPDSEAMQVVIFRHLAGGPEGLADTAAQRRAVYWQRGPSISNPSGLRVNRLAG